MMVFIQKYKEIVFNLPYVISTYYIKSHFLLSISQKYFSGTRFSERVYFFINESIGQLGAEEG